MIGGSGGHVGGGFRGPPPPLWDQALEQEKRLRAELRKKSFWDPDVRRLRGALQGTYEALVFEHYEFAAANDLATPEEARAQLGRTTGAYLRFLDEALAFYRKTVWKLQWVFGDVGARVDLDAALQNEIQEYQSMALKGQPTSSRPLWERAGAYYRQAAAVQPESGNPYNQLAVMAYFTGDELRAVYYYFRSLAVALPFVTARENLLLLFEKNRSRRCRRCWRRRWQTWRRCWDWKDPSVRHRSLPEDAELRGFVPLAPASG
eukprot:XP_001698263.1 predicted protein [Chlamydomonas reinhardtii]